MEVGERVILIKLIVFIPRMIVDRPKRPAPLPPGVARALQDQGRAMEVRVSARGDPSPLVRWRRPLRRHREFPRTWRARYDLARQAAYVISLRCQ